MTPEVRFVTAADTLPLRLAVLRSGTPSTDPRYPQDERPDTWHLGAFTAEGLLIGVASWTPEPWVDAPARPAMRLRGMAVRTDVHRSGTGAALVDAGLRHCRALGAEVVWATARDAVLGFYERLGFAAIGDGFIDAPTGMPHHRIVLYLPG